MPGLKRSTASNTASPRLWQAPTSRFRPAGPPAEGETENGKPGPAADRTRRAVNPRELSPSLWEWIASKERLDRLYNEHVKRFYSDPAWRKRFQGRIWEHRKSLLYLLRGLTK